MFGIMYTVEDDVDTLSRYPVITPFGTAGGSHVTTRTVLRFPGFSTVVFSTFPGTECKVIATKITQTMHAYCFLQWSHW